MGRLGTASRSAPQVRQVKLCSWQKHILQLLQKLRFEVFPCPDHPSGLQQEGNELFGSAASTATVLCVRYNVTSGATWLQEGDKVVWGLPETLQAASQAGPAPGQEGKEPVCCDTTAEG